MENENSKGDQEILDLFKTFMQKKTNTKARNQDYPYKKDVSTVNMYTGALRNYILPATRSLIQPCNTLWFLDCITPKEYTFEGKQTTFVKPQEPIYMRARIVKEALKISQEWPQKIMDGQ